MGWNQVTLTDGGAALLANMLNGSRLVFSHVAVGSEATDAEALAQLEALTSVIPATAIYAGTEEPVSGSGTVLKIQIRNDDIVETVRMRQIGLYARAADGDEVLFGVLQDDIGEEIPTYGDFPQFLIELAVTVAVSRTDNIAVEVSPSVYVTQDALVEAVGNVALDSVAIKVYTRDSSRPSYGFGGVEGDEEGGTAAGDADQEVTIVAEDYTGTADVALVLDDMLYDAGNVTTDADAASDGDIITEGG